MAAPRCPDCKVAMKAGWIPDAAFGGVIQAQWHEGGPAKSKNLGVFSGLVTTGTKMMPIQAFRCPDCGLVRTYAFPRKWNKVK